MFRLISTAFLVSCIQCLPTEVRVNHLHRPGGFIPVPTNDARVKQMAAFAVNAINERSNCLYQYKLTSIDHAAFKIVDGVLYRINMTTCMYNPQDKARTNPCANIHPPITRYCGAVVLGQPWMEPPTIMTEFQCNGCGP